jgi:hypothetical protein
MGATPDASWWELLVDNGMDAVGHIANLQDLPEAPQPTSGLRSAR